jgi:hypothetical protein
VGRSSREKKAGVWFGLDWFSAGIARIENGEWGLQRRTRLILVECGEDELAWIVGRIGHG